MQDLTQGSIPRHILLLAAPIGAGMVFQTLYFIVDLYFVSRLGDAAIAGVGAAGNLQFIVMALTQVLAVGAMALIAQASGRRDRDEANLVFNQSLLISALSTVLTVVAGYLLAGAYMGALGADAETVAAGLRYLYWFLPGLALQFAMTTMGAALRGTGIARPTMLVQMISVLLNTVLAPILIAGWLTGRPMGVAGAGLATSLSVAAGTLLMLRYFLRLESYVGFQLSGLVPHWRVWRRIFQIGLPPGGEMVLMFVYMAVIYWIIRDFGAHAQAGFSVGMRVMQAIFLPAMAIAFATAPVAGQNMGAGLPDRVRATFRAAALQSSAVMVLLTLLCQWRADAFIQVFSSDPDVIEVGGRFLRIISWNFVAAGLIFTCSGMFQAIGNTMPGLLSGLSRLVLFVPVGVWVSHQPWFELRHLWFVSVGTMGLQALVSVALLQLEFRFRLSGALRPAVPAAGLH